VIQLQSLAFGAFAEAEPLNPRFAPGHPKLRLTVDTESAPQVPDRRLLRLLVEVFPGLERHRCQVSDGFPGAAPDARGIVILNDDPSANQAHILEHLLLEMLSLVDHRPRLSGVTCAYNAPPERSDIFVECDEPRLGAFLSLLALETLNVALAKTPIAPLYGDATRVAGEVLAEGGKRLWMVREMSRRTGLAEERAADALRVLRELGLVEEEEFAMNFSGEPSFRFVGRIPSPESNSGMPGA
jgi:hypothetical protein